MEIGPRKPRFHFSFSGPVLNWAELSCHISNKFDILVRTFEYYLSKPAGVTWCGTILGHKDREHKEQKSFIVVVAMFIIYYFHTPEQEKMEEQRERFPVQALQCINSIKIITRFNLQNGNLYSERSASRVPEWKQFDGGKRCNRFCCWKRFWLRGGNGFYGARNYNAYVWECIFPFPSKTKW